MADVSLGSLPWGMFKPDTQGIIDAGDISAVQEQVNGRDLWKFVDGSDESAMVSQSFPMPTQYNGTANLKVAIRYFGDSAPAGNDDVKWEVAFEAVTDGDAHDIHGGGDYFAAAQNDSFAIDSSAGRENVATLEFTNVQADSVQPGDSVRLVVRRDCDAGAGVDDYADSVWVESVEILYVE